MRFFRLRRFAFAFWLGLLALTASGVAQNQLSANVLTAALTDDAGHAHHAAGHYMPDGTFMPGEMHVAGHAKNLRGHTHKGHSDCTMCSAVASMAGLSTTVIAALPAPEVNAASLGWTSVRTHLSASSPASYSSRAPPILIG